MPAPMSLIPRVLRPLVTGARIAAANPNVKREAAIAARYASRVGANGGVQNVLMKTGQALGSGGRRIARVYSSPAGQLGLNAAFIAPMFIPMGGGQTYSDGYAVDPMSQAPYQSMPPQPIDNYDPFSAGYTHQPSMMPDIPQQNTTQNVMDLVAQQDMQMANLKAKYQQMGASPFSY
jgi:hypothetical protein